MRLFHFSEDPTIALFVPRPVRVSAERPPGMAWLNGPLVWAVADKHQPMYLFPRECPRILLWVTLTTRAEDYDYWWQGSRSRVRAYIEKAWFERVESATIYRYEMPVPPFEDLHDAGMWVSKTAVKPLRLDALSNLLEEHRAHDVELRVVETHLPLKGVWRTSLHASGIRLCNAQQWGKPGWTHAKKGRVVPITEPS